MKKVITGIEALKRSGFATIRNKRLGLLANSASVDNSFTHLATLIEEHCQLDLIFAPEHGFRAARQDMADVRDQNDQLSGRRVISLYGNSAEDLHPKVENLEGLDIVLVDLPDIGTRYYTFSQTMYYLMQAAAKCGVKVIVLDRPNPISGSRIEGSPLLTSCRSFCGVGPVANRHGLTLGELALMFKAGIDIDGESLLPCPVELQIIPVEGWSRAQYHDETGIPWVLPSPNMPCLDAAVTYPGTCLFEATNISEGRGTTKPFELLGAPFINGSDWIAAVAEEGISLDGLAFRPTEFEPQFHKWQKQTCGGIQMHITDRDSFSPYVVSLALISALYRLYPGQFAWRTERYEFIDNPIAIDLLYGSDNFRRNTEAEKPVSSLLPEITSFSEKYSAAVIPFMIY